jgi:hypothetical protein
MTHKVNVVMTSEKELKADTVEGTVKIGFYDSKHCNLHIFLTIYLHLYLSVCHALCGFHSGLETS